MEICKLPASRGLTFFKNGRDNRISDIICNLSATWGLNCCSKKNQTKKDIIRYLKILKCSAEELEKRQNLSCWNAQVKKRWTDKHGKAPTNDDAERIYLKVKFNRTRWSIIIVTIFFNINISPSLSIIIIKIIIVIKIIIFIKCFSHWRRPSTCFPPTRS